MRETIANAQFTSQIERLMVKTQLGLVTLDDIAAVQRRADARTPHGWFIAWMERAGAARETARRALEVGDVTESASAYLRASEYFRAAAAVYWPDHGDASVADALRLHVQCFRAGLDLDGPPYRTVALDTSPQICGYLLQPSPPSPSRGVLLCAGPGGSTAEEQYGLAGMRAIRLGWSVLLAASQPDNGVGTEWVREVETLRTIRDWLVETLGAEPARLGLLVAEEDDTADAEGTGPHHGLTGGWIPVSPLELKTAPGYIGADRQQMRLTARLTSNRSGTAERNDA